jgi:hypothetical protein
MVTATTVKATGPKQNQTVEDKIPAEGWYVAHPDLTVGDVHRVKRVA